LIMFLTDKVMICPTSMKMNEVRTARRSGRST
jgi:hypothetical protein